MHLLNAHCSNQGTDYRVQFIAESFEDFIEIKFVVEARKPFYTSQEFSLESYENWNLWNFDVVECFLSFEDKKYLELQVSPLNQKLALLIERPREVFHYPKNIDLQTQVKVDEANWSSKIKIHKSDIPGDSNKQLLGNVFAILGESRSHFALYPNEEIKPNFHRPDLFGEVIC